MTSAVRLRVGCDFVVERALLGELGADFRDAAQNAVVKAVEHDFVNDPVSIYRATITLLPPDYFD